MYTIIVKRVVLEGCHGGFLGLVSSREISWVHHAMTWKYKGMESVSSVDPINYQLTPDDGQSRATLLYICEFLTLHWMDLNVLIPST